MKRYAFIALIMCLAVTGEAQVKRQQSTSSGVDGYIGVYTRGNPRTRSNGIEISAVERGGPADEAGIRPGDVIISIDGTFPVSIDELRDLVQTFEPGERVDVSYRRGALISETYIIVAPALVTDANRNKMQGPSAHTATVAPLGHKAESPTPKMLPGQRATAPDVKMSAPTTVVKRSPSASSATGVTQVALPRQLNEPAEHTSSGEGSMASATADPRRTDSPTAKMMPSHEAAAKPRVYVKGQGTVNATTLSGGAVTGGDSWLFGHRSDTTVDIHDESIELSKDIREQCPGVIVTLKEDSADFFVMLNRESKAKKGLLSKNNQVLVANKTGDVIWTKDVRQVKSAAKDVCAAILSSLK